MKLSFSTLGCPDWPLSEIVLAAADLKLDGVEIRGIENEMYAPLTKPFLPENIEGTLNRFSSAGLEISMLTSAACLTGKDRGKTLKEAHDYIDLAKRISCKYVRVLVTPYAQPTPSDGDVDDAVEPYRQICDYASTTGVIPLVETNGPLADSNAMAKFIEKTDRENAGVLWDIHHPFRFFGESPWDTAHNLENKIKYIHIKDSVIKEEKIVYKMMGCGDVPILEALKALKNIGYDSYISLEWVKRWNRDLEEPGIVFSHYASHLRHMLESID